jgi:hypothetical protein
MSLATKTGHFNLLPTVGKNDWSDAIFLDRKESARCVARPNFAVAPCKSFKITAI